MVHSLETYQPMSAEVLVGKMQGW